MTVVYRDFLYIRMELISVQRHAVCLHSYLLSYSSEDFLVSFAALLCLACDKVKVVGSVCEDLIDEVDDELHVLLDKAS